MIRIEFIAPDGVVNGVAGREGLTVMEVAVRNGIAGIDAECGGACSCATCHVIVDADWFDDVGPPGDDERELLAFARHVTPTSRLSCQIRLNAAFDGLRVRIPPSQS